MKSRASRKPSWKKHLGHQVEITGRIAQATGVTADDVPDFQATSLKMVSATCPAVKYVSA